MKQATLLVMGVALATLFFAFLTLTAQAGIVYYTTTQTTLEDFNEGELYHTGLTRSTASGGDGDGEVRLLTVGIAGEWYTATNATGLPALVGLAAAQYNGYIYVVGGYDGAIKTRNVYYTRILTETHDLTDWSVVSALPSATYPSGIYHHGAAVLNGRIYVVGGWDQVAGDYFAHVCHAPINADGTLGSWSTTTSLPQGILYARVVAVNGRLYVLGGQRVTSPIALDTVYYAEPDPVTGVITPGGWSTTTALPNKTFAHMVTTWGDRIYVAGGSDGVTFYPYVNYATPLTTTGAIEASDWMTATDMEYNLYGGAAIAVNGELFTTGGAQNQNSTPSAYVGASLIERDGSLGSWVETSLIDPARFFHAVVSSNDGWLYVIGGAKAIGTPIDEPLINRGAIAGEDARSYAPKGEFTSSIIDLGKDLSVVQMSWNTFVTDTTAMSVTLSYRTRLDGGSWNAWQGPYPSAGPNGLVTTTLSFSTTTRYLQYSAILSTTIPTRTPALNWVQFKYILPNPDLRLTKDDGQDVVHLGDVITYTFWYTNVGNVEALDTAITETVPAHTTPYGANPGWTDMGDDQYRYYVSDTFSPTQSFSTTFVVQVDPQVPDGTSFIYDYAVIESRGDDETPNDNETEHFTDLEWVDLRLALSDGITAVQPGMVLTYTTSYTNAGSVDATSSQLTLTIPAYTAPYGTNAGWTSVGGQQYVRDLGTVAPGGPYEATFVVRVDDPLAPSVTTLVATAVITDDGSHGPDANPADNIASDTDVVEGTPDLRVTISDGTGSMLLCQTLNYTIEYSNVGDRVATNVVLTATLPASMTYVGTGWTYVGNGLYTRSVSDVGIGGGGSVAFSTVLTQSAALDQASSRARSASSDGASRTVGDWPDQIVQKVSIGCAGPEIATGNEATDTNPLYRPNLHVVSITPIPSPSIVGQPTTFRAVIGNSGDAPVANDCCYGFNADLYVDPGYVPGGGQYSNVNVYDWVSNVEAHDGTKTVDLVYTFPTTGTFTIYVQANPDRYWYIPESAFDDNTSDPLIVEVISPDEQPPKLYLPLIMLHFW